MCCQHDPLTLRPTTSLSVDSKRGGAMVVGESRCCVQTGSSSRANGLERGLARVVERLGGPNQKTENPESRGQDFSREEGARLAQAYTNGKVTKQPEERIEDLSGNLEGAQRLTAAVRVVHERVGKSRAAATDASERLTRRATDSHCSQCTRRLSYTGIDKRSVARRCLRMSSDDLNAYPLLPNIRHRDLDPLPDSHSPPSQAYTTNGLAVSVPVSLVTLKDCTQYLVLLVPPWARQFNTTIFFIDEGEESMLIEAHLSAEYRHTEHDTHTQAVMCPLREYQSNNETKTRMRKSGTGRRLPYIPHKSVPGQEALDTGPWLFQTHFADHFSYVDTETMAMPDYTANSRRGVSEMGGGCV
ncbi:uncharacterized protein B0H18DRAFT_1111148 [Fomitopsis serialis]|uniref:uncharacterized protein n=1 Tax=Fomitopsis serialis TaxID=139415 RepID=UPI002008D664|nr:uncharacterized protein B0H18DRAFT_1111148 [Neoantrodia serialis]KAH9910221.1 hypothetical protein B0H18DRAFT_1111148 [Neoantrodia serialis]